MLRVQPYRSDELPATCWSAWDELQRQEPTFDSPYFRPEFTLAVSRFRPTVEVGVIRSGREIVGFFPFDRRSHHVAMPVGRLLSDFHGVIVRPDIDWDPLDILRQCRLRTWHFHHLHGPPPQCHLHCHRVADSPFLDLSNGFDAYWSNRWQNAHKKFKQIQSSMRKLERELGEVRLDYQQPADGRAMEAMMVWKSLQFRETRAVDLFAIPWIRQLLGSLCFDLAPHFAAVTARLYGGEHLLAVSCVLRSGRVMHGWFMSYDQRYRRYSPGLILLVELAKAAAAEGVVRIDLGKGPESYKPKFATGALPVGEGTIDCSPLRRRMRGTVSRTRSALRDSSLRPLLLRLVRPMQRVAQRTALQK